MAKALFPSLRDSCYNAFGLATGVSELGGHEGRSTDEHYLVIASSGGE